MKDDFNSLRLSLFKDSAYQLTEHKKSSIFLRIGVTSRDGLGGSGIARLLFQLGWRRSRSSAVIVDESAVGEGAIEVWLDDTVLVVNRWDAISHVHRNIWLKVLGRSLVFGDAEDPEEADSSSQ